MSRKIIGVTVGTAMNPQRLGEQLKNGKSAYELAVENGFEGTEVEWLASLHGKNGRDGQDGYTPQKGKDYFDGKDGKDGIDGYRPVKGEDYFTEADKNEMVQSVITALPKYDGEVVAV